VMAVRSPSFFTRATFPGQADPNRAVAEGCASALLKTAATK